MVKKNIKIKSPKNLIFSGRKNLIRRCIANIINNSQKYSENIFTGSRSRQLSISSTGLKFISAFGPQLSRYRYCKY